MTTTRLIRTGALAIGFIALLGVCAPANAALVVYSGVDVSAGAGEPRPLSDAAAASYDAAAAGLGGSTTLVDFESAPVGAITSLVIAPGVSITSAQSTASINNAPSGSPSRVFGFNTTLGGAQYVNLAGGSLTFTFAQGVQAFGAYITGVQLDDETVTFNDGSSQSIPIPNPGINNGGVQFLGFTDVGKSIVSITLTVTGDIVGVDDVRWTTSAVPEPSAFSLIAVGFAGAATAARRRKSAV
jgi:hypothetical protein